MKLIGDVEKANIILHSLIGAKIIIWLYSPSLTRLLLRIEPKKIGQEKNIVYLLATSCISIKGPFRFTNVGLTIMKEVGEFQETKTIISDKSEGFELITSSGFVLAVGVESEFGESLEHFLLGEVSSDQ